jgi:hypothetical protein
MDQFRRAHIPAMERNNSVSGVMKVSLNEQTINDPESHTSTQMPYTTTSLALSLVKSGRVLRVSEKNSRSPFDRPAGRSRIAKRLGGNGAALFPHYGKAKEKRC